MFGDASQKMLKLGCSSAISVLCTDLKVFICSLSARVELYGGTAFWAAVGNPTHSD